SSVLVGNKFDLINTENRVIDKEESDNLKQFLTACGYFETSAKSGTGIDEFFLKLISHIYKSLEK
ncbi:MAG: hypothetical protein ACFFBV_11360, partial [Promethearchaeota archaeon]